MTAIQICALIVLIVLVGLTYWAGYRGGLIDGRLAGIDEGKDIQQSDNSEAIQNLNLSIDQARAHRKQLFSHYERALAASKLGEPERQTLLDIAEILRIAAETFSAFRTGKKLERDTLRLRDQARAMAALLDPVTQEPGQTASSMNITNVGGMSLSPEDAKKASLFFRQQHLANIDHAQKVVGGEI